MRLSSYANCRILALLLTAGLIAIHPYLPRKVVVVYPFSDPRAYNAVFGPERTGKPTTDWIDRDKNHFWCSYAPGDPYSCEWLLNLAYERPKAAGVGQPKGWDLSNFEGINLFIRYQGNAPRIRFGLRNYDPAYSKPAALDATSKALTAVIKTEELTYPTFVLLSEFSVAEWWVTEYNVPREHSAPSMNNVISLGLSFNVHSENTVLIDRVELIGDWIKKEQLYLGIILLWMAFVMGDVFWRFKLIRRKAKQDTHRIGQLAEEYMALQKLKEELEILSTKDVLTGVMNRAGIQQILDMLFDSAFVRSNLGILLFDVDYFKKVNDQYGHDTGDVVLSTIAKVVAQNVRHSDVLGRWGGEEFILICPQITLEQVKALGENLRKAIERQEFSTEPGPLKVTISIGATIVNQMESFESAFKRADTALYAAKKSGRNQIQLA